MNTLDKYMKEQSVSNQSMKDSGIEWIGKIPIDWNIKKLKRCIIEINEKNNPVKMTNVLSLTKDKGVIPYENKGNQGNKSKEDLTQYKIAYKDTIIANSMNVIIGSVGISNYDGCVSPAYYVFKSNVENDLRFINYIFQTESFQKQLRRYANGILEIRLRISFENLLSQQIPTPSLNEQRKIADFLDNEINSIDKLITNTQNLIEEYESYKTALITQTVTHGLNPDVKMKDSEVEWIGEIPEHWKVNYLSQIFFQLKNKNKNLVETNLLSLSYGKIKQKDINSSKGLLPESFEGYNIIDKNDIVLRLTDLQNDHKSLRVGYSTQKGIITSAYITLRSKTDMNTKYYYYLLHTFDICKGFYGMGAGVRQGLNFEGIKKLKILNPPLNEQKEIVNYLDNEIIKIENIINQKEKLIVELEDYKKSLIFEYTTGKKRVYQ